MTRATGAPAVVFLRCGSRGTVVSPNRTQPLFVLNTGIPCGAQSIGFPRARVFFDATRKEYGDECTRADLLERYLVLFELVMFCHHV
jgi:hypothetical protein